VFSRLILIPTNWVRLLFIFSLDPRRLIVGHSDNSGARVHELSAPLAAAGISILYQSSYMSDFILVSSLVSFALQTRCSNSVHKIFRSRRVVFERSDDSDCRSAGSFDLYDSNLLTSRMVSPLLSPVLTDDSSSVLELGSDITTESGAVLTRTRSSTESSLVSSLQLSRARTEMTSGDAPSSETGQPIPTSHTRSKSHSPTSGEVDVLTPDLACVGLSDEHVENWGLKIVKLVAFPELIPSAKTAPWHSITRPKRFYSSHAAARPYDDSESPFFEPFSTVSTPPTRGRRQTTSSSSSSSSSGEDGYFSHSPTGNDLTSSPVSSAASRSYPDVANH
jgi:hypothetical protein